MKPSFTDNGLANVTQSAILGSVHKTVEGSKQKTVTEKPVPFSERDSGRDRIGIQKIVPSQPERTGSVYFYTIPNTDWLSTDTPPALQEESSHHESFQNSYPRKVHSA